MPFVRIDLALGTSTDYRTAIGDVVYESMLETLDVPKDDRFQVITEHPADGMIVSTNFLGIQRTASCILIQVTLSKGRTVDAKRSFYKAVADGLHARLNVRREDIVISLVEVQREDWSFGNGEAQYVLP
jgi:4-oxalocrotonate tautomerase